MEENDRNCPDCGMEIPVDALGGLCPACTLDEGLAETTRLNEEAAAPDWLEDATWLREALPDYELISEIGRGGMGRVLKARHKDLNRLAAIKILSIDLAHHDDFIKRFKREAQAMAKLVHPNIVQIYDYGQREKACYIVMEFVEGVDLKHVISTGNLSPEQALAIVPQICDALQYAHDLGVIHRDIKPANVIVGTDGAIKVADFGLAKVSHGDPSMDFTLTGAGEGMGTRGYMAPEQEKDVAQVDNRADIYSLGVMLYEMLTGDRPSGIFKPPSKRVPVDVRIDEVVLKSMDQEPEGRYQQVSEVKSALAESSSRIEKPVGRKRGGGGRMLLAVAVLLLLAGVSWWQQDRLIEAWTTIQASLEKEDPPPPDPEEAVTTLVDVVPIKAQVDRIWLNLQKMDRGQGFGDRLDALDQSMRVGQAFYDKESFADALPAFESAMKQGEALVALQAERVLAEERQEEMQQALNKASPLKDRAPTLWESAEEQRAAGVTAFDTGDFALAVKSAEEAVKLYVQVDEEGQIQLALSTVKSELAQELLPETRNLLDQYGGQEWTSLQARISRGSKQAAPEATKELRAVLAQLAALSSRAKATEAQIKRDAMEAEAAEAAAKDLAKALAESKTKWSNAVALDSALLKEFGGDDFSALLDSLSEPSVSAYEKALAQLPSVLTAARAAAEAPKTPKPGEEFTFNLKGDVKLELVWIPAGKFTMGTPENEPKRDDDEKQHEVEITQGFWMGKYEVTQAQYKSMTGKSPSFFSGDNLPVEMVSWDQAQAFCKLLTPAFGSDYASWYFRLPTEAEWEYACRAGTKTATAFGDSLSSAQANVDGELPRFGAKKKEYIDGTVNVGSYKPNVWGLFDMHGNVYEFCEDWYDEEYYSISSNQDPCNRTAAGSSRVMRGGCWVGYQGLDNYRSGNRAWMDPDGGNHIWGFRVVLSPRR